MQKILFASLLTLAASSLVQNTASVTLPAEGTALHSPGDYVEVNGTRLWVESEGTGQALVLIPAGPGVPQFVMFEKSGHFPFIEEPEEFIRVVGEFLRK
jgi:hypothetical protein